MQTKQAGSDHKYLSLLSGALDAKSQFNFLALPVIPTQSSRRIYASLINLKFQAELVVLICRSGSFSLFEFSKLIKLRLKHISLDALKKKTLLRLQFSAPATDEG